MEALVHLEKGVKEQTTEKDGSRLSFICPDWYVLAALRAPVFLGSLTRTTRRVGALPSLLPIAYKLSSLYWYVEEIRENSQLLRKTSLFVILST